MAEGSDGNEYPNYVKSNSRKKRNEDEENTKESVEESTLRLDIGQGSSGLMDSTKKSASEFSGLTVSGSESVPRREENPFSFKHFLNRETSGGARPKVYTTPTPPPSPAPSPRLISNPELTSGLPDFVQDHLVIEQCYLNSSVPTQLAVDLENLPDFAPLPSSEGWIQGSPATRPKDMPFDLTLTRRSDPMGRLPLDLGPCGLPLDLASTGACSGGGLPLDLARLSMPEGGAVGGTNNPVKSAKSLPDFLSDGPIRHSGLRCPDPGQPQPLVEAETSPPASCPSADWLAQPSNNARLQMENERLRRDCETARRQLTEQIRRGDLLEAELNKLRSREHGDTSSLEKVIEQVEDDLKRTTKRAVTAENRVSKLKQEIKHLMAELTQLRGGESSSSTTHQIAPSERLASELRAAANTAEASLRQLLSGVDNLRAIASTLDARAPRLQETFSDEEGPPPPGAVL